MLKRIAFPYRITILYIFFGALWILFSDKLAASITIDPHQIQRISLIKGWLFIAVTGFLLFSLVKNEIKRRNLIYEQLLEAKKKAEESDRLKTTFLSNLSHYIRTPMNGILGFIELLEDKDISEENHLLFSTYINDMSQNLLQTLNSIIEISRIQAGQANVNIESFKLNELMERIAEKARIDLMKTNKNVDILTINGFTEDHDNVTSDREKIRQVLSNIMDNAVNFTDQGTIEIGYAKEDNNLVFWVKDTGKGISEEKTELLFNGFLNNTSTTYTLGEGAGLGLPLSSGLIKLLGGNLWIESTGKSGSKFCFSIPATNR